MVSLIEFDRTVLDHSWEWLQNPLLRKLIDAPEITKSKQLAWFNKLPNKADYLIWGVAQNSEPIGAIGLKNIRNKSAEYFGYIGLEELWGKGLGKYLLQLALEKAKSNGIESLWLKVLCDNPRALRSYEKFGFKVFYRDRLYYELRYKIS